MTMTATPTTEPPDPNELRDASKILALAARPALRPVDYLVAEAELARDPAWITRAFRDVADLDLAAAPKVEGAPLAWHANPPRADQLEHWRLRAKYAYEAAGDVHARNAALLVYAWCIAAALVHFNELRSSQPREDIDQLLAGVATVLPEPYASLPRRALHIDAPNPPESNAVAHAR
jgi:hypothetical protein